MAGQESLRQENQEKKEHDCLPVLRDKRITQKYCVQEQNHFYDTNKAERDWQDWKNSRGKLRKIWDTAVTKITITTNRGPLLWSDFAWVFMI